MGDPLGMAVALSVPAYVLAAACAVLAGAMARSHGQERERWTEERRALLERCLPGLGLRDRDPGVVHTRTDAEEWRIERERLRSLGLIDGDPFEDGDE